MKAGLKIVGLIVVLACTSCEYTDIVPLDVSSIEVSEELSFATDIEPIFKSQSCTNCHPGLKKPDLSVGKAYSSLIDGGFINKDKPEESGIYVAPSPNGSHAAKLTAEQSALILAWIKQGAKDN